MRLTRYLLLLLLVLHLAACGDTEEPSGTADLDAGNDVDEVDLTDQVDDTPPPDGTLDTPEDSTPDIVDDSLYRSGVTEVKLEVDYESGAEPFTSGIRIQTLWSLFESNAQALFEGQGLTLTVPTELAEMESVGAIPDTDFGAARLLELANMHWDDRGTAERHVFYVLFVDGYYQVDGERQANVLGVSVGNTGIMALFKPAIENSSASKFVEQAVLVHEFGHAVGLVGRGTPVTADHVDEEHGAHCSNESCVMFWLNEGAADMAEFSEQYVQNGDSVLFDQDCLNDVQAAFQQ